MGLLQMSFTSVFMILVIIIIRAIFIHKLPKKMFLILWAIALFRLLLPFSIPSEWSIYSIMKTSEIMPDQTQNPLPALQTQNTAELKENTAKPNQTKVLTSTLTDKRQISVWSVIWISGTVVSLLYFTLIYFRCRKEFQTSLPSNNEFVKGWLIAHKLKRSIQIKQSDKIAAPLTYGIVHPVILMPKNINWEDTQRIRYILEHEWLHIRRFDALLKLIMVFALCIHWFNPMVWGMYLLFNRDIELSCDETVVKLFGENVKSAYAMTLISMEEKKSKLMPLCNNFSRNAIEERITAIMKIKKTRIFTVVIAVIVVLAISIIFLTSASNKNQNSVNSDNSAVLVETFQESDYEILKKFQFENMENMTIKEHEDRTRELLNSDEYKKTYEKAIANGNMKNNREQEDIFYYNAGPLLRGGWKNAVYNEEIEIGLENGNSLIFTYKLILNILNADSLTLGEYNRVRETVSNEMSEFLINRDEEEIKDSEFIKKEILPKTENIMTEQSSDMLTVTIEGISMPALDETGNLVLSYGSKEDYISFFTLKTQEYQNMLLQDFNQKVLDWCNDNYYSMERIIAESMRGDYREELTEEEKEFLAYTFVFSREENAQVKKSLKSGEKEDFVYRTPQQYQKEKEGVWCRMNYNFSYYIPEKNKITVGERDKALKGIIGDIDKFWNETDIEEMLTMSAAEIKLLFHDIAEKNSNEKIKIYMGDCETPKL